LLAVAEQASVNFQVGVPGGINAGIQDLVHVMQRVALFEDAQGSLSL
jgi:hypothetical protein